MGGTVYVRYVHVCMYVCTIIGVTRIIELHSKCISMYKMVLGRSHHHKLRANQFVMCANHINVHVTPCASLDRCITEH